MENNQLENNQENIQANFGNNVDLVESGVASAANRVQEGNLVDHEREENTLERAKENFKEVVGDKLPGGSAPASVTGSQVSMHELKSRLNWGEPGLTILDVRDRATFQDCHIMGAMNTPVETLPGSIQESLQYQRDIYVYGSNLEEANKAAQALREAGFQKVAVLEGGLSAWQEIDGSVDGILHSVPTPGAYNVADRLKEFAEEKQKENRMK
jgi:rhodanese-related sulfurtransferase